MRFNKGIHNILVERGIASENTAMLFMCFYGPIRQTNMATDSFNIYLSPVGVKSLDRFIINWQAGAKLIRHAHEYNGFVTLNASTIKKRHDVFIIKGNSGLRDTQHTMYSWTTLFISLPQVLQQRESTEYWSRNSLTVVTARVLRRQWVLLIPPSMSG